MCRILTLTFLRLFYVKFVIVASELPGVPESNILPPSVGDNICLKCWSHEKIAPALLNDGSLRKNGIGGNMHGLRLR